MSDNYRRLKYGTIELRIDVISNSISIPGTNEASDFLTSFQCWKKKGFHAGCYKWVEKYVKDLYPYLDENIPVRITGHSLGGAIAQVLAVKLTEKGYFVELDIDGAFPAVPKKRDYILKGKVDIYGNDPVPSLFPWFGYPVKKNYCGPDRKWWKIPWQWVNLSVSDHMEYWK